MLPDWKKGSYGPHKLACTFLSLLVVEVILLFLLITRVDLFFIHRVHNLSSALLSSMLNFIRYVEPGSNSSNVCYCVRVINSARESSPKLFKSSKFTNTSIRFYLFVGSKSMLSTNLKAFTIHVLLTWANCWCQKQIHLFLLTRWVD